MSPAEPQSKMVVSSVILKSFLNPFIVLSISWRQLSKTDLNMLSCSPGSTFSPWISKMVLEPENHYLFCQLSIDMALSLKLSFKL